VLTITSSILSMTNVFVALTSKSLFDSAQYGRIGPLFQSALVIISIVLVQATIQSFLSVHASKLAAKLSNDMRLRLFSKLSETVWKDFISYHSGDLITRITSDTENVINGVTSVIPGILSIFASLVSSIIVLAIFDPLLALIAFLLGPLSIIFTRIFSKKLKDYHIHIQETESISRGFLQERFSNMHIIKALGLESTSSSTFAGILKNKLGWVIKRSKLSAASNFLLYLSYWIGFLLSILWGSVKLSKGTATFGTITVFLQLVGQIQDPFTSLAMIFPQFVIMYASAGRLIELYELPDDEKAAEKLEWRHVGVIAEHLSFRYNNDASVLADTSFIIRPSEFIAITGTSGKGKTTFIRLLLSLLKPTGGHLVLTDSITGTKKEACKETRSLIAYVPQGNTLFSGTIAENILLGNRSAAHDDMVEAMKSACIWDFVADLPNGIDTVIGENGYGLSEGQAQRISIARALISKKPVLVLDEATSALDADTELKLLNSIASITPRPTCIIITHRPAAIDFCDRVLNINDSVMTESPDLITK
jgi:ATP-binding cassette subfamily B protein